MKSRLLPGVEVYSLYIAKVKKKAGIREWESYPAYMLLLLLKSGNKVAKKSRKKSSKNAEICYTPKKLMIGERP
ncbi:MAG: hypothetical protein VB088_03845 [Sphaerochaeta sp.]|nr:hypothetical protein [Sphaerochaeta sp.]